MKVKKVEPPYVPRKTSWLIKIGEDYYNRIAAQPPFNYTGGIETHTTDLVKLKKAINEVL